MRNNLFIAHTPLQNFVIKLIIEQYFYGVDNVRNYLFTSVELDSGLNYFDEIYIINKNSTFKKIINLFQCKYKITRIIATQNSNSIFIPHTSALIDNFLFYGVSHKDYNVDLNFYYEGILYLYNYRETYKFQTHFKRLIFGFLLGICYKYNPNITPFNSNLVNKVYTLFPEHTVAPKEKLQKIKVNIDRYVALDKVLILGGRPSLLTDIEIQKIYNTILNFYNSSFSNFKLLFKGHHADSSGNFEKVVDLDFENITQHSPVEEIIEIYQPKIVISYPSSGLINLKSMYGNKIDLYSYYINEKKDNLKFLWPIFENVGINLKFI